MYDTQCCVQVTLLFTVVVGFRVIVIFLGWQDRDEDTNLQGAWEFVQPVWFLLMTLFLSNGISKRRVVSHSDRARTPLTLTVLALYSL